MDCADNSTDGRTTRMFGIERRFPRFPRRPRTAAQRAGGWRVPMLVRDAVAILAALAQDNRLIRRLRQNQSEQFVAKRRA